MRRDRNCTDLEILRCAIAHHSSMRSLSTGRAPRGPDDIDRNDGVRWTASLALALTVFSKALVMERIGYGLYVGFCGDEKLRTLRASNDDPCEARQRGKILVSPAMPPTAPADPARGRSGA